MSFKWQITSRPPSERYFGFVSKRALMEGIAKHQLRSMKGTRMLPKERFKFSDL